MNRINYFIFILVISILSVSIHLQNARAHGTGHRVIRGSSAITVEFFYSDNEPMSYSEVMVFSPEDKNVEYQNGRTDREGRFAFCPRSPGKWRIEANDGMGHKAQSVILVEQKTDEKPYENYLPEAKAETPATTSKPLKTALGLSLIANLAFAVYVWRPGTRTRKKSARG